MVFSVAITCMVPLEDNVTFFNVYKPGLQFPGTVSPSMIASAGKLPPSPAFTLSGGGSPPDGSATVRPYRAVRVEGTTCLLI